MPLGRTRSSAHSLPPPSSESRMTKGIVFPIKQIRLPICLSKNIRFLLPFCLRRAAASSRSGLSGKMGNFPTRRSLTGPGVLPSPPGRVPIIDLFASGIRSFGRFHRRPSSRDLEGLFHRRARVPSVRTWRCSPTRRICVRASPPRPPRKWAWPRFR